MTVTARARFLLAGLAALAVAGCTNSAVMTPANDQARASGGDPRVSYIQGIAGSPMRVTMPDGEVLPGSFHVSESGPAGPVGEPGSGGNFYATAQGPRTSMVCHGNLVAGHGVADCRTGAGASYRLQL